MKEMWNIIGWEKIVRKTNEEDEEVLKEVGKYKHEGFKIWKFSFSFWNLIVF